MSNYEIFCDHAYYDTWAVRKKGSRTFGEAVHVMNEQSARQLVAWLDELESKQVKEDRSRVETVTDLWTRLNDVADKNYISLHETGEEWEQFAEAMNKLKEHTNENTGDSKPDQ